MKMYATNKLVTYDYLHKMQIRQVIPLERVFNRITKEGLEIQILT